MWEKGAEARDDAPESFNVKGIVLKPEDGLNTAVYGNTARKLLSNPPGGDAGVEAGLTAFPQALERYSADATDGR